MKKRFGFSVLELLALLVTISIVTAALAPVFTKRVRSVNATANPSKVSQNCSNRFSAYCTSCNIRECLTCDRLCKQTETVRISTCTCHTCSEFYANCFACAERQCTKCMQGYWLDKTDNKKCTACIKGYYCDGYDQKICTYGTYQKNTTKDYCVKCPTGTYQDEQGKDSCKTCPAGFYCPKLQLRVPIKCPPGWYSAAGAVNCTPCPAGTKPNDYQTGCDDCPAGTFSAVGAAKFVANGQYEAHKNDTTWVDFSAGYHRCIPCEDGTYSGAKAGSCTKCSAGYYSRKTSSGGESDPGPTGCTACPAGTYNPETGASRCIDCEDGQYSGAAATVCTNCSPGRYSKAHATGCTICPAGTFSVNAPNGLGPANCTRCSAGYYQPYQGQSSCYEVPAGHYSVEGATGYTACSPGYYQDAKAQKNCKSCPAGTYNTGTGNTSCTNCGYGRRSTSLYASTSCTNCEIGQEGPSTRNSACIDCPGGYYASSARTTTCSTCPANSYSTGKAQYCTACPSGMVSTAGSSRCWDPNPNDTG